MKRHLPLCASLVLALAAAGAHSTGRTSPEAALDPTFVAPRFTTPSPASGVLLLPDGGFLRFFNVNALVAQQTGPLTKYFSDGTLDSSFRFSRDYYHVGAALRLPDGKFIISASQTVYGAEWKEELVRLNSDGSIDPTFSPITVSTTTPSHARGLILLPNGKLLVAGSFSQFGSHARPGIVRLHADGTLDTSFAVVPLLANASGSAPGWLAINHPAIAPDGKIIIYGNFQRIGNSSYPAGVARLHSDGTVDSSFQPSGFTRSSNIRAAVVQADGKVVIGSRFSVPASFAANPTGSTYANLPFVRLNPDGSADDTYGYFNPAEGSFFIRDAVLQPDGKVAGTSNAFATRSVYRFNLDGTLDTSFRQPEFQFQTPSDVFVPQPVRIALQGDGRLLVSGLFSDVDSPAPARSRYGVARFHSDGTLDGSLFTNTATGVSTWPQQSWTTPTGKTLISFLQNDFGSALETPVPNNFARLDPDGSFDATYNPFANPDPGAPLQSSFVAGGFVRLAGEQQLVYGQNGAWGPLRYGRLLSDGTQDLSFTLDPNVSALFGNTTVHGLAQGSHGVIFTASAPQDSPQTTVFDLLLRRITFSGALDPACRLPAELIAALVVRHSTTNQIMKIFADGRVLAVQPDGKILFVYLDSDTTSRLIRLHVNGTVDSSFAAVQLQPLTTSVDYPFVFDPVTGTVLQPPEGVVHGRSITECEVLPDGRLLIVGPFRSLNGTPSRGIARLQANGTVDSSFVTGTGPEWTSVTETATVRPLVEQVEPDRDGKLIITGTFEAFDSVAAPGIARLNSDGSIDSSAPAPVVRQKSYSTSSILARQEDGSFLLSGPYTYPGDPDRRPALLRLLGAPQLTAAASRKTHGSGGSTFDLNLPLTGTPGVECRSAGAGGAHTIVFTFNNALTSGSAVVTDGAGSVAGTPVISGKTMAVELIGVTNAQRLSVSLQSVTDVASQVLPDTTVTVGFLLGDANNSGNVNASDISQVKSLSGVPATTGNFRNDINASGAINATDVSLVKALSGSSLPTSSSDSSKAAR
ncbi:hypothetical protein BH20VER1_BH20VER1_02800 [soil metagenome]